MNKNSGYVSYETLMRNAAVRTETPRSALSDTEKKEILDKRQEDVKYNSSFIMSAINTTGKILNKNLLRRYLLIQNQGAVNMVISFGSAGSSTQGIIIVPAGYYEPYFPPNNDVYVYGSFGYIVEG